ncbi:ketopantoate reductase family protein [Radiobacillus deserti]|uniref:ketopantoate reductase family protein n=1 Tax=Radiobacillus deserti TaxID=2594883 RepID=UPI0013157B62|nr:2-dehydropantoate 2-reductase [Radiobacillus deserti]
MRVGVIGGGAVGLLTAYFLSAQHDVTIYVRRQEQKSVLIQQGVVVEPYVRKKSIKVKCIEDMVEPDIFLICVKSYHLPALLPSLESIRCPILFMQNGMGHIKWIKEAALPSNIGIAVFEHGVRKINDNKVLHTGVGRVRVGAFTEDDLDILHYVSLLHQDVFPFYQEMDWETVLQEKLIANAVINPITAIFQVENGVLLENPHLAWMAKKVCEEVATSLGQPWEKKWEYVKGIIQSTKENRSSMLVDMDHCRKTEVEEILGYLLDRAKEEIPYVHYLYHSIKALERQKRGDVEW